jgi:hypothetical protein
MNQNPRQTDTDKSGLLARALELASELADSGPRESETDAWSARAYHVGDLAVLALAFDD